MAERISVTEDDLRRAIQDPRYWTMGHPERGGFVAWVTDGFRALHGPDAKGGTVQVQAYTRHRDGKEERVGAHTRGAPPGGGRDGGGEVLAAEPAPDLLAPAQMLPWLLAKPPFYVPPVRPPLMRRSPGRSGKEAATDIPSWARGQQNHRRVGEDPIQYARRLMDERYGPGNWGQGTGREALQQQREFKQIRKSGQRAFEGILPLLPDDELQA